MRVIAQGTGSTFLLVAERDEIANLAGFYYGGISECPPIKIGAEIKVAEMYKQLKSLKDREKQLNVMTKDLRLLADLLELKQPIIFPVEEKETIDGQHQEG